METQRKKKKTGRAGRITEEATADETLQNPRVEVNTCDTVYFGSYWQEDINGDGVADRKDDKTPIRWRILSQNGDDAYVIADKVLDCKQYNEEYTAVTWETSTLRTWLNGEFLNSAFTAEEQAVIVEQILVNADNEENDTEGGNDTKDKVYLPSIADMKNTAYGFSGDLNFDDQARLVKATAYAKKQGVWTKVGGMNSWWWLRSPGESTDSAAGVNYYGSVITFGDYVNSSSIGVRPALCLNLFSPFVKQGEAVQISLKSVSWDLVELGTYNGKPIVWRVLNADGDDVYLLSEKVLDERKYTEEGKSVTWKESTLRNWLNGEFYEAAFSETERAGIKKYKYENKDHPWYGTEGGENTEDYVTLLSLEDMVNQEYGFPMDHYCEHQGRSACDQDGESWWWWLRSPGKNITYAAVVDYDGCVVDTNDVNNCALGVRPALHFERYSSSLKKVGTVSSDGTVTGGDNLLECTEHSPEADAAVAASGEKEGKTEGSYCSVCGK